MRFIRKGGRVIPIKDPGTQTARYKAGMAAQKLGVASALAGGAASVVGQAAHDVSMFHGAAAMLNARGAQAALKNGQSGLYAARKAAVITNARMSLRLGKISNVARAITKPALLGALALVGGGIGMTAHRIGKKKG